LAAIVEDAADLMPAATGYARSIARLVPASVREARRILQAPERAAALAGYRQELTTLRAVLRAEAATPPDRSTR
jgi:hypothetical protein